MTDRHSKLRNYAARKVAERQQQQSNQTQKSSQHQHRQQKVQTSEQQQQQEQQQQVENNNAQPIIKLSRDQKLRQRTLLKPGKLSLSPQRKKPSSGYYGSPLRSAPQQQTLRPAPIAEAAAAEASSSSNSSTTAAGKNRKTSNNSAANKKNSSSKSNRIVSTVSGVATSMSMSSSNSGSVSGLLSSSSSSKKKTNMTSAQKAAFLASQQRRKSSDRAGTTASSAVSATSSSNRRGASKTNGHTIGGINDEITVGNNSAGSNVASNSFTTSSSNAASNAVSSFVSRFHKGGGGNAVGDGKAQSTIGLPSLDNRDKMKRLFAARRRKAQMEMTSTTPTSASSYGVNTSIMSEDSEDGDRGASSNTNSRQHHQQPHQLQWQRAKQDKVGKASMEAMRESSGSVTTIATLGTVNTTDSSKSSSSHSVSSSKSSLNRTSTSSYSSRRALDRYLGKSKRNSVNSSASASVASVSSLSNNSSAGNSSSGYASSSNGIGHSGSADSMDNHTVGSLASRTGITTLTPVREESFHSGSGSDSTTVYNAHVGRTNASRTPNRNAQNGQNALSDSASGGEFKGGVSSEFRTPGNAISINATNASTSNTTTNNGATTSNNTNYDDSANNEKSVRFHLSPLERQKAKEKQELETREQQKLEEKAQCSPPRLARETHGPAFDGGSAFAAKAGGGRVVEEEEDMEFTIFVAGLRREVVGEHAELWSGFQSLLGCPPSSQVPLHESYVDESNAIQELDRSGKKKKKKKIEMDPQTQKSLTTIHKHLMENGRVKGKFMTNKSQLVNDKRVKKDRAAESGRASTSSLTTSSSLSSVARRNHRSEDNISRAEKDKNDGRDAPSSSSTPSRPRLAQHDSTIGDSNDVNVGDDVIQQPAVKLLQNKSYVDKKTSQVGRNNNTNSDAKFASVKLRSVSRSNSSSSSNTIGSNSNGEPRGEGGGSEASAIKPKLSWMEALKKKQNNLRLQMAIIDNPGGGYGPLTLQEKGNPSANSGGDDDSYNVNASLGDHKNNDVGVISHDDNDTKASSSNDDNIGMGGVVLRRVNASTPRKKPRMTPPSTPEEQVAPWASLQLRSTPKKRGSMTPTMQVTTTAPSSARAVNGTLPSIQAAGSWGSSSSSLSFSSSSRNFAVALSPVNTMHTTPNNSKEASSSLPPLCYVGDIIDLDSLPQNLFPAEEGPAAIFPLKRGSKTKQELKQSGKETERVVIVGKTAIVTASTAASVPERKVGITWWCRRTEIRALTLNVEATGANLSHAHGRTPLLFESTDVCLDFAQVFYGRSGGGGTASTVARDNEEKQVRNSSALSSKFDAAAAPPAEKKKMENATKHDQRGGGTTNNDVLAKSNLTEDEESLLDRYRQFSHSDRTKLRLTCLSPRGEGQEVEVSLSPPTMTAAALKTGLSRALGTASSAVKNNNGAEGGTLSDDEEKIASKYRKMLKMGIPPDAVQHKMNSDEIPSKIASAVLGGGENNKEQSKAGEGSGITIKLSDEEEALANKYRKMMKMRIPPEAVRHKMTMEGAGANIIRAVFDEADPPSEETKTAGAMAQEQPLSRSEEVIASKYRKLLKMGVPLSGVEHKMKQEGIDFKIISALVEQTSPSSDDAGSAAKPSGPKKSITKSAAPSLSKEDEAIASKYRNMLKVCIPKDAVRHKMKQEGVSIKIMEAVLGKETNEENESSNVSQTPGGGAKKKVPNRKTIALHWTTSNLAPELLEQSIFGRNELKKRKLASINPEEADIKKLEELFQKRNNAKMKGAAGGGKAGGGKGEAGSDMAKLMDLTRANNIAISLKKFNDFTFRSLAETINDLDPDCKIVGERVQFIPNLLPTPKETQAIKKYKGEDDKLITAELFFRQLVPMKRIEDKVQVMRTMSTLEEHVAETRAGFQTLQIVCSQIMNSEKLFQVLELVLNIGNLMNAGSVDGGVEAFKFESLPRLSQTKSADGKTTVLDYIVETFIEKGERRALLLMGEFPDIQDSSRLLIGDLIGDMEAFRKDYKLCKTELTSMKRDQSSKRVTRSMTKKIKEESSSGEVNDPRNAMFAAIKAQGVSKEKSDPSKPAESSDPMQALFGAIKSRNKSSTTTDTSGDSPPVKYSPGVLRLEEFLTHSKTILSFAEQDQDAATRACKGLAVYCGEEGGERAATPLLQVLSNFALSLENGVKKYDGRVAAEKKRLAKKKKEIEKEKEKENSSSRQVRRNTVVAQSSSSPKKLLRASSFQPHVGVTKKVRKVTTTKQVIDPMGAVLAAIKGNTPSQKGSDDAMPGSSSANKRIDDSQQALLASIKNRGIIGEPPTHDGVTVRGARSNKKSGRSESRILMVNQMLSEAPANVKQDFLKGVTYNETDDPLLRKIYEKEGSRRDKDIGDDTATKKNLKPVDTRTDLFASIRNRKTPSS